VRVTYETICIKPEYLDVYVKEHANVWSGVLAQIKKSNIQSISTEIVYLPTLNTQEVTSKPI